MVSSPIWMLSGGALSSRTVLSSSSAWVASFISRWECGCVCWELNSFSGPELRSKLSESIAWVVDLSSLPSSSNDSDSDYLCLYYLSYDFWMKISSACWIIIIGCSCPPYCYCNDCWLASCSRWLLSESCSFISWSVRSSSSAASMMLSWSESN